MRNIWLYLHRQHLATTGGGCAGDITAVTFRTDWDTDLEASIVIDGTLTPDSMMEVVMKEGGVFDDLGLTLNTINRYKFLVQKKSGNYLTFKWENFKNLKVNTFIHLNNIDTD